MGIVRVCSFSALNSLFYVGRISLWFAAWNQHIVEEHSVYAVSYKQAKICLLLQKHRDSLALSHMQRETIEVWLCSWVRHAWAVYAHMGQLHSTAFFFFLPLIVASSNHQRSTSSLSWRFLHHARQEKYLSMDARIGWTWRRLFPQFVFLLSALTFYCCSASPCISFLQPPYYHLTPS